MDNQIKINGPEDNESLEINNELKNVEESSEYVKKDKLAGLISATMSSNQEEHKKEEVEAQKVENQEVENELSNEEIEITEVKSNQEIEANPPEENEDQEIHNSEDVENPPEENQSPSEENPPQSEENQEPEKNIKSERKKSAILYVSLALILSIGIGAGAYYGINVLTGDGLKSKLEGLKQNSIHFSADEQEEKDDQDEQIESEEFIVLCATNSYFDPEKSESLGADSILRSTSMVTRNLVLKDYGKAQVNADINRSENEFNPVDCQPIPKYDCDLLNKIKENPRTYYVNDETLLNLEGWIDECEEVFSLSNGGSLSEEDEDIEFLNDEESDISLEDLEKLEEDFEFTENDNLDDSFLSDLGLDVDNQEEDQKLFCELYINNVSELLELGDLLGAYEATVQYMMDGCIKTYDKCEIALANAKIAKEYELMAKELNLTDQTYFQDKYENFKTSYYSDSFCLDIETECEKLENELNMTEDLSVELLSLQSTKEVNLKESFEIEKLGELIENYLNVKGIESETEKEEFIKLYCTKEGDFSDDGDLSGGVNGKKVESDVSEEKVEESVVGEKNEYNIVSEEVENVEEQKEVKTGIKRV